MRGLTAQERYVLRIAALPESETLSMSLFPVAVTLRASGRMAADADSQWHATDLGRLALRVCPPEDA